MALTTADWTTQEEDFRRGRSATRTPGGGQNGPPPSLLCWKSAARDPPARTLHQPCFHIDDLNEARPEQILFSRRLVLLRDSPRYPNI
jgi:hypothetical protein